MVRFALKLILCLLVALAAGFGYLALRSGDALYRFYEWVSPARLQQYDTLIVSVAAEHQLEPMPVTAVAWREIRFDRRQSGTAGGLTACESLAHIDLPATRKYIQSILDRYAFYKRRGRM